MVKFQLRIAAIVRDCILCHISCKCKSCENHQQKFWVGLGKTLLPTHNMAKCGNQSWPSIDHTHSDNSSTHLIAGLPYFTKTRLFPQAAYFLSWPCQYKEFSNPTLYWVRQSKLSFWTILHMDLLRKRIHSLENYSSSFFLSLLSVLRRIWALLARNSFVVCPPQPKDFEVSADQFLLILPPFRHPHCFHSNYWLQWWRKLPPKLDY